MDQVVPSTITIRGKQGGKNQKAKANHAGTKWLVEISEQGLSSQRLAGWRKKSGYCRNARAKIKKSKLKHMGLRVPNRTWPGSQMLFPMSFILGCLVCNLRLVFNITIWYILFLSPSFSITFFIFEHEFKLETVLNTVSKHVCSGVSDSWRPRGL